MKYIRMSLCGLNLLYLIEDRELESTVFFPSGEKFLVELGSILGPLLFIIFINDLLGNCHNGSDLFLYADDAKLFRLISCDQDVNLLQKDLLYRG